MQTINQSWTQVKWPPSLQKREFSAEIALVLGCRSTLVRGGCVLILCNIHGWSIFLRHMTCIQLHWPPATLTVYNLAQTHYSSANKSYHVLSKQLFYTRSWHDSCTRELQGIWRSANPALLWFNLWLVWRLTRLPSMSQISNGQNVHLIHGSNVQNQV